MQLNSSETQLTASDAKLEKLGIVLFEEAKRSARLEAEIYEIKKMLKVHGK